MYSVVLSLRYLYMYPEFWPFSVRQIYPEDAVVFHSVITKLESLESKFVFVFNACMN